MKPKESQKKLISQWVDKWKYRLFLGEWHLRTIYQVEESLDGAIAECHASPKYLEADIIIYPKFWRNNRDRWEHTIVHELAHCQTAKVSLMLDDALNGRLNSVKENEYHIEQLTERIANIVYQQEWNKIRK